MTEFFELCFSGMHLPYTLWLSLNVLYWLTVIVGLFDADSFDIDVPDVGAEVDGDIDVSAAGDGGAAVLHFFHLGDVPLTIILTISAWSMWGVSLLLGNILPDLGTFIAIVLFVPNFILSLFVAKFATYPLRSFFHALKKGTSDFEELSGETCIVKSDRADGDYGQAEVIREGGAPLLINVRTVGDEELREGEEAVIIEYKKARNTYLIASLKPEE